MTVKQRKQGRQNGSRAARKRTYAVKRTSRRTDRHSARLALYSGDYGSLATGSRMVRTLPDVDA